MDQRPLGNDTVGRIFVGAIGLGFMPMSWPDVKDDARVDATVRAALDAGVNFIDTADCYGAADVDSTGQNEQLLRASLERLGAAGEVTIATKAGCTRDEAGGWGVDGTPEHLRAAVDASLDRLGLEQIALYQFHRPDPAVDFAESLGARADIQAGGKVRMVGISNADPDQIRLAADVLGGAFVSVQNQFAPNYGSSRPELELCDDLGLAFLPWSPLGGIGRTDRVTGGSAAFAEVAAELGVSPQRACLAWMLSLSPVVLPIPGSSRPETVSDSAAATEVVLSADQVARLSAAVTR